METKLLYLEDAYLQECNAQVLSRHNKGKKVSLVLSQTVMQPSSRDGGDKGTIVGEEGSLTVQKVIRNAGNGRIDHTGRLEGELVEGETVKCNLNWPTRINQMRKHDLFHLLYSCARQLMKTDFLAVSKISVGESYSDWMGQANLNHRIVSEAAELANKVVQESRPIMIETLPRHDALQRCGEIFAAVVPQSATELRLVTIQGFPPDPCIGLHVKTTDEIGPFRILRIENAKENLRIFANLIT